MLRLVLSTVLGAIVFFVWGALAWTVLQIHSDTIHDINNEQAVMQVLKDAIPEPGMYWFPAFPEGHDTATGEEREAMMEQWSQLHRDGPIGLMNFHPHGFEPMAPMVFATGFGLNLLMALIASLLLIAAGLRMYLMRVVFVASIGLVIGIAAHMTYWNYMHFPLDYSLMMVLDNVVGWSLAGLVMAACVRPKPNAT
jgi:hypothetical protein